MSQPSPPPVDEVVLMDMVDAFLVYALCLLYLLFLSAMNFVFLLLPDGSPPADASGGSGG